MAGRRRGMRNQVGAQAVERRALLFVLTGILEQGVEARAYWKDHPVAYAYWSGWDDAVHGVVSLSVKEVVGHVSKRLRDRLGAMQRRLKQVDADITALRTENSLLRRQVMDLLADKERLEAEVLRLTPEAA